MEDGEGQLSLTYMGPVAKPRASGYDPDQPDFVSDSSRRMYDRSRRPRHLMEGLGAIERNLHHYLPKYPHEDAEDYNMRKRFLSLRNYFAQSVTTMLGKMFAQPPRLNPDVPREIQEDLEDADLNGTNWTLVARDFAKAAITEGIAWLVVDMPPVPDEVLGQLTIADERELGVRPYWYIVPQSRVLGIRYKKHGQVYSLTQFRFIQWTEIETGEYGSEWVEEIFIYGVNRVVVKRRDQENGNWYTYSDTPNTLGRVPAVPVNLERTGRYQAKPPLENLAHMNIEHVQIRSDQRRALSVASFPILVTAGVEAKSGERTRIGPLNSIMLENEKASVKWVESQGVHLKAGADELKKLEEDMRIFGLAFENPQAYATATGRNIDASDAIAPIQMWSLQIRDALEVALAIHAAWRKLRSGGSIDINVSFLRNMITIEGLKLLVEALKEGAITPRGFLTRLKEYGILSEDFDVDKDVEEALKIAEETAKRLAETKAATKPQGATDDEPPVPPAA